MVSPETMLDNAFLFAPAFRELTGHAPYSWQEDLFLLLVSGKIPTDVGLPTGTGKTSIMAIWVIALAAGASVPRRLVWVVDRRVVVDQATSEAEQIAVRLSDTKDSPLIHDLRNALEALSLTASGKDVLAISTLRGEREDNRAWSTDPSRPAIVVGTVDMIGSRLLFSGYGDGRSRRASHAGLLGQDSILVNDEAHLTPAFASLLGKLARMQTELGGERPLCVMRLSATHQNGQKCWPQSLEKDRERPEFRKVFEAPKRLEIVPAGKQHSKLLELAVAPGPARTLIFLRKPEEVRAISIELGRRLGDTSRIICLTGTMRGFERDQLVRHSVFQEFAAASRPRESCWLIATSAAEVGVNISSDRLITDLDTADHLTQRLGRLNRFGETEGQANLLVSEAEIKDAEQKKGKQREPRKCETLDYLRNLLETSKDVSTSRLFASPPPATACSETPLEAQFHNWLVDVWSQTSLGAHPARPSVGPWLHGKKADYPETYVAWREDVPDLIAGAMDTEDLELLLAKYPVLAHERLREPTYQLQEKFAQLAQKSDPDTGLLCLRPDGSVTVLSVRDVADKNQIEQLMYGQLILPPGCGSLDQGMFSPDCRDATDGGGVVVPFDLAGCELDQLAGSARYSPKRACYRATPAEDGWQLQRLGGVPAEQREQPFILPDLQAAALRDFADERGWRLLLRMEITAAEGEDEADTAVLLYFKQVAAQSEGSGAVLLEKHLNAVAHRAADLAGKLGLGNEITRALLLAGKLHDLGKQSEIWQRAAGNRNGGPPLAKSATPMRPHDLHGFRHELASLRHAERELVNEPEQVCDLALHLIAAHHGHARPCFEKKTYDRQYRQDSERLAIEAAQRFGRVQKRYGAWGLAYLEAMFKAADALASANAEEPDA
jgi:CRISPR-associated endonuclease/helicase Cas3